MVYGLDFAAEVAINIARMIAAAEGSMKKCIVLDLDNTLWGGIIGDDGIDAIELDDLGAGRAFTDFQYWLRNLKERGIILAVCSKNTESIARDAFEQHPSMILRMEDIAVFMANWSPKAQNIATIRSVLNIGYDSIVFIDDDPVEREMIRQHFPEITVPDLPDDPALYVEYLQSLELFETASYTPADTHRTQQYQDAANRLSAQQSFESLDAFLQSLDMQASVRSADAFTIPRIAQLTQRSNQFNLRTQRYSVTDVERMAQDESYRIISISLKDRFGDYGLISVLILKRESADAFFLDTWIMSCRVLKRGVEALALNEAVRIALASRAGTTTTGSGQTPRGTTQYDSEGFQSMDSGPFICSKLIGEYLPTLKNAIVKDHYADLGFTEKDGRWELDMTTYQPKEHFIRITEAQNAR
jgi:FkbH-like protein